MIKIREFNDYFQAIKDKIDGITDVHLVAEDSHASDRLGSKPGIHMVVVIPNAQRGGQQGMGEDMNATFIFVLETKKTAAKKEEELDQYERTQNIMLAVREQIEEDSEEGCWPMWRLETASIVIDPEYNVFRGWNGWSMGITF